MKLKPLTLLAASVAMSLAMSGGFATAQTAQDTFLIEAEEFQFPGGWVKAGESNAINSSVLMTHGADSDALTVVSLPKAGNYKVWVRSRDFSTDPGTRRYKVGLDGVLFEQEFGAHGTNGWKWEKAGERQLEAGDHVLALHDTARFYGRADAFLLTTEDFDPNTRTVSTLAQRRVAPKNVTSTLLSEPFANLPALTDAPRREVAVLENELVRIRFLAATDTTGKTQIVRETTLKTGGANVGGTTLVPVESGAEKLFVQYAAQTKFNSPTMVPTWNTPDAPTPKYQFTVGGKQYIGSEGGNNPYWVANAAGLAGRSARKLNANSVAIDYEAGTALGGANLKAVGRWELLPGARDARLTLEFAAPTDGYYSIGFSPFSGTPREQVQFNLLSPLYQFQRLPRTPVMLTSSSTPQPLALSQVPRPDAAGAAAGTSLSLAVIAEPERLPFEWSTINNAHYGFSLLNPQNQVQPTIFAPVLGLASSQFKTGQTVSAAFRVLAFPGDWKSALEYSSEKVFGVTDYRKPYGVKLSDAAINMVQLMKNADASGWDAHLKGWLNIEAKSVASQASPLTVVSAAVLSRDEELWQTRALPTIEYTLSRPGAHFGTEVPDTYPTYINEEGTKIKVPSDFYGTAYWQGLHDLLGRANPWLTPIAAPEGQARHRTSYSSMPKWSEMLATYRLNPTAPLLQDVEAEADKWLQTSVYARQTRDLGVTPFYNMTFYPYWWDLLDLYELTQEKKYLDAASEAAFFTIAGLWSHPRVPEGNITIHPGGEFGGEEHLWWKGDKQYRLGLPRTKGDTPEKQVPAWLVAQMGLGLEQPSTYHAGTGKGMRNIMMSAWAPHLLRLHHYTGREIFRTYARNTIISRFGTYPGYYMTGYTDQHLTAEYPFKGPDVTSIYYHHIPPQLAFTIDFLVTEAEARSNGKISFPWVKQQGYVWFTNRLYGHAPGTIFGDGTARLWMNREVASVASPAINTLLARGNDRVHLVLLNEADTATTAPVTLDRNALGLTGAAGTMTAADGTSTPLALNNALSVTVPAKGLVTLSFPAARQTAPAIPSLEDGRASQKLSGDWGTLEAFRIRSPFGKDSLYVVLTGRPAAGATATLEMAGQAPIQRAVYPYEFSVYPVAMDQDMTFTIKTKTADGQTSSSTPVVLKGTR